MLLAALLGACSSAPRQAPVIERLPEAAKAARAAPPARESDWRPQSYTVRKGDTLYSIALDHGFDYRELAEWNGIENPNLIRSGQQLRFSPPPGAAAAPLRTAPAVEGRSIGGDGVAAREQSDAGGDGVALKTAPKASLLPYSEQTLAQLQADGGGKPAGEAPKQPAQENAPAAANAGGDDEGIDWVWPAEGKIIVGFDENANLKGLDISGRLGQPVLASAAGKVVYSGSGIRGYGKLIVIKHSKEYSSVYTHNNEILVKEGQTVAKGQKIAEMGNSDADRVKLHFEIRRLGRPVDPARYLPGAS